MTTPLPLDPRLCPGSQTIPVDYSVGSGTTPVGRCNVCGYYGTVVWTQDGIRVTALVPAHLPGGRSL